MFPRTIAWSLTALCLFASVAQAASKNVLVFTPDGRESDLEPADAAMLQKAIESDLAPALAPLGYTVLTEETARVLLQDKHINADDVRKSETYLQAARALKLALFVTAQVTTSGGKHAIEVRLFDSATGNMIASGDVEGEDGATLRKSWKRSRDRFIAMAKENLSGSAAATVQEGPSADELKALRAGCDRAEPSKCLRLGRLYEKGEGVKADRDQAIDYYGRACSGGYPEGCAALRTLRSGR